MIGLHPAIDAIYRKNMRSGNIEEATAAWEKEMFGGEKVEKDLESIIERRNHSLLSYIL